MRNRRLGQFSLSRNNSSAVVKSLRHFLFKTKYLYVLLTILFIAVATYLILTTSHSVRYLADDYCVAVTHQRYGLLKAQEFWWKTWSARYSCNLMLHISTPLGEGFVRLLPPLIYVGLISGLLPLFRKVYKNHKNSSQISILIGAFLIAVILVNAPNIIQSFYWQSGSLTYSMPLIFFNLFLSLIFVKSFNPRKFMNLKTLILAFLLTFIAGGFTETFAAAQMVMISLALLATFLVDFPQKIQTRKLLLFGLFGALASVALMMVSPGLRARGATLSQGGDMSFIIKSSLLGAKWYILRFFSIRTSIYSLLSVFSLVYFLVSERLKTVKSLNIIGAKSILIIFGLSLFSIILTTITVFGVSYYAMAYLPPERALFIVVYFIILAFVVASICISLLIYNWKNGKGNIISATNFIVFISSVFLLTHSFYSHWLVLRSQMANYAKYWKIEEQKILEQKNSEENIEIRYMKPPGGLDGFIENEGWVASCVTSYYGIESLTIVE